MGFNDQLTVLLEQSWNITHGITALAGNLPERTAKKGYELTDKYGRRWLTLRVKYEKH